MVNIMMLFFDIIMDITENMCMCLQEKRKTKRSWLSFQTNYLYVMCVEARPGTKSPSWR